MKDKGFEIVSVAQDSDGLKAAGPVIAAAKPEYTVLIDPTHRVTRLYDMVNVPTAVWINEQGRIVRSNETAYVDNALRALHGLEAAPYLRGLRDWVEQGERSAYVLSEKELQERLTPPLAATSQAAAEFALAEYLHRTGRGKEAIAHFKEAQRLSPENWNYKRQAWALGDSERDYGTSFFKEVQKLKGKPYYPPRKLPDR